MVKELKEFLLSDRASIAQIKEFLGYEPTDAVLDNLNACVDEILAQMPEEEIRTFYNAWCKR